MAVDPVTLQQAINAISNSVVRAQAQRIFDAAVRQSSQFTLDKLDEMLGLSARDGDIGVFYSGGDKNKKLADECSGTIGDRAYTYIDTDAGKFAENFGSLSENSLSYYISDVHREMTSLASAMMGDQAPQLIAFVEGSSSNSTWQTQELTASLENGTAHLFADLAKRSPGQAVCQFLCPR